MSKRLKQKPDLRLMSKTEIEKNRIGAYTYATDWTPNVCTTCGYPTKVLHRATVCTNMGCRTNA